ncbi:MAG: ACP phosphodiesterase [Pseudomonadales bacterium]
MNHLAHFHLSAPQADLIVGSVLGDYVKGRLSGDRPANLDLGIRLHRVIDGYTDRHSIVRNSWRRFDKPFQRYGSLMTDIIFDYFLANEWQTFHQDPLCHFHDSIFSVLDDYQSYLPANARRWSERMKCSRAITAYDKPEFIHRSFVHLSGRLSRNNPLGDGYEQFETHKDALQADFHRFYPEMIDFVVKWKQHHIHFPG